MSIDVKARRPRHPKPTVEQNAGRNIRRAADIIQDRGWIRGRDGNKESGFCIRGALIYAIPGGEFMTTWSLLQAWIHNVYGDINPVSYNDEVGRTKEEILLTLNNCADELDPKIGTVS